MKSFDEICEEQPQHAAQARAVIAKAHELFAVVRDAERNPTLTDEKQAKKFRAEYEKYYQAEIVNSKNPIIQELIAQ